MTRIVPGSHSSAIATPATIYGIRFPTNGTVTEVSIGPPVSLPLSNVVVLSEEQISAIIPAGGGIGTGTIHVAATTTNGIISFGKFINQ